MRKWRFTVLMLLPLLLPALVSCSIGKIESRDDDDDGNSEKLSWSFTMPSYNSNVIVDSDFSGGKGRLFFFAWDNDGKVFLFAKQNGKMINIGRYPISSTSSDNTSFRIDLDAPDKLDTKVPYQLYGITGTSGYNVDDNELFCRVNLVRNNGTDLTFSGQRGSSSLQSKMPGTAEVLYIINKTDKPIQFTHKGFDVEEKWYYTKAEVSVEDGHLQKTEQGSEVVGKAKTIAAFNGTSFPQYISTYVPTGKKIQDAQLIAEIDGKEVRSENRISSDITLQTNHVYGIYVVWDGEKLTLGDGEGSEPVVIDVTDPESTDVELVNVENDGTMTLKTTMDKVPHVGEYLWSGPSDKAPYGFMARVVEVKQTASSAPTRGVNDIIAEIKTVAANINEVVENGKLKESYVYGFDDIDVSEVTDAEGNTLQMIKTNEKEWKFPKMNIKIGNVTLTPEVTIIPNWFRFSIDIEDYQFKAVGMDIDMNVKSSVKIDASLNAKKEVYIPIYNVFIKPIIIGYVVITPLIQVYAKFDVSGNVTISCVPVRNDHHIYMGAVLDGQTGNIYPVKGHNNWYDIENLDAGFLPVADIEKGFSITGSASASIGASASFGLYGCNYAKRVSFLNHYLDFLGDLVSIDVWADAQHKMDATFAIDNIDMDKSAFGFHFNDGLTTVDFAQLHGSFILNYWNPITLKKHTFSPTLETPRLYFAKDYNAPTLFVSAFSKFTAALSQQGIVFTATKHRPLFGYSAFEEQSFGIRYAKCDDGDERKIKDCVDVNMSHDYGAEVYKKAWNYQVTCTVPVNKFERGHTYVVYPYIYVKFPDGVLDYIYRPGISIYVNSDGTLTKNALPIIPGHDL